MVNGESLMVKVGYYYYSLLITLMNIIKLILTGAIGLFIIMLLLSLLIPSTIRVSRNVLINNATVEEVSPQVKNLDNWKNWHPAFKAENTTITIVESSAEIKYNGKTARLIINSIDSNSVKFILQSPGENDVLNEMHFIPLPPGNAVKIDWLAINKLKWYPWEKFYGIFVDKLTGPSYETALQGLKAYFEP
jgi:hypothetical protein